MPAKKPWPGRLAANWPPRVPRYTRTLLHPLLATIRSAIPSPFRSASVTAPGASRPEERSPSGVFARPVILDGDTVEPWFAEDDVLGSLPVRSATARSVLVRPPVGLEGAIALAQQGQDVAVGGADEQVRLAVAVDVGDRKSGRIGPDIDRGLLHEPTPPVTEMDRHSVEAEQGEVGDAVEGEVGGANDPGRGRRGESPLVSEGATTQSIKHSEGVRNRG